jgi:hypothetical protein
MTAEQRIQALLLRSLHLAGDRPLSEDVLCAHLRLASMGHVTTAADARRVVLACEAAGWITGVSHALLGTQWALTPAGQIACAQL